MLSWIGLVDTGERTFSLLVGLPHVMLRELHRIGGPGVVEGALGRGLQLLDQQVGERHAGRTVEALCGGQGGEPDFDRRVACCGGKQRSAPSGGHPPQCEIAPQRRHA